ncbi:MULTISPECIES: YwmB family TATA-box binding protein [Paenibacillus]|jgi:hypothetical protein|uniref:TATA-box binding n=1 Tax=Paenibacillus barengoltzii J12 TaxID=935846 RepID=A0ABY1M1J3_9BACL|nr:MULTISPECIES: YwmB family TATA-box binding protein [Paenibacillus]MEC2343573.1 YwmB family TATA-box binding protein [Paenibacillus barengoltzii]SMF48954.1 TATA-box binding [Paenibacillus barengoltzii]SMF54921.1 TATA-box binding [Paenibacillus barengoltzii J12]
MQNRKIWSIGVLILVCAMLLVGLQRIQSIETSEIAEMTEPEADALDPLKDAEQQLDALVAIGEAVTSNPFRITVKWQGDWDSLLSSEEAAGVLATRLGLSSPESGMVQGRTVYQSQGQIEGIHAELDLVTLEEGKHYAMLRLEAAGEDPALWKQLQEAQRMAGESLADEGVDPRWNAAIQGMAWPASVKEEGEGSGDSVLAATLDRLESQIKRSAKLKLKQVEAFGDEGTASRTYRVDALPITILSGEHHVALQVAVHRNSGTGMDEITIGTPLLTVEY